MSERDDNRFWLHHVEHCRTMNTRASKHIPCAMCFDPYMLNPYMLYHYIVYVVYYVLMLNIVLNLDILWT